MRLRVRGHGREWQLELCAPFAAQRQPGGHGVGGRPQHGPLGIVDGQADAMPGREHPGREMHFDVQVEPFAGHQRFGFTCRVSVGAVEGRAGDLGDLAIGRHVGQPRYPVGARGVGADPQQRPWQAENAHRRRQRLGFEHQAVLVGALLIGRHRAPPHHRPAGFHAHRGAVGQGGLRSLAGPAFQAAAWCGKQAHLLLPGRWPAVQRQPMARHGIDIGAGWVPAAYEYAPVAARRGCRCRCLLASDQTSAPPRRAIRWIRPARHRAARSGPRRQPGL